MSLNRFMMERTLRFRVPGIKKINSIEDRFKITVYVGDETGAATGSLLALAQETAEKSRPLGSMVEIMSYNEGPGDSVLPYELSEELKKAHVFNPTNKTDLLIILKNCIPGCINVDTETVAGGVIDIFLGDEEGQVSQEMIKNAKMLLQEIFDSSVQCNIYDFNRSPAAKMPNKRPVHLIENSRFDPALFQDRSLQVLAREDEEHFSDILSNLINGSGKERDVLKFRLPKGGAVYTDLQITEERLKLLLTLYSRVYLPIRQDGKAFLNSPVVQTISTDTLLSLSRMGRIIPVFHAPLHQYDVKTVLSFMEDPNIKVILPRQLDGLTVLTLAKQFPFWKKFREDPQTAAEVHHIIQNVAQDLKKLGPVGELQGHVLTETFNMHLTVAEMGEQWFLDKGHIAAGNLTAGGTINSLINYSRIISSRSADQKAILDTVNIEAHVYSMNMAMARAFGAVYDATHVLNHMVLDLVARLQTGTKTDLLTPSINEMEAILKGCSIVCPEQVSLTDYLEVIHSSEAERLRGIITDVITDAQGSPEKLIEEIERFNQEVVKWRKSKVQWVSNTIDFLGIGLDCALFPTGVSVPGVTSLLGLILKPLLGKLDKTSLGKLEDRIFAAIGGVSPAAVRISKIRKKIGSKF
ncbi:MAG: hypothetical protein GX425_10955 [Peptococcaceae bacterium]|nr:hypothetical protein [Peptococcaceae bacterium]